MNELQISDIDKILIIAPHADDESIGVGGLLSEYGSQCDVWLLTDGSNCGGLNNIKKDEIVRIRNSEFINVMKMAGVNNYKMFGLPDGALSFHLHDLDKESIEGFTKIFIPSPDEDHPDHKSAYIMSVNLIKGVGRINADVYCYEITRPMREYNYYLDISSIQNRKRELIQCHITQVNNINYVEASLAMNHFRGLLLNKDVLFAEVFNKIEIGDTTNDEDKKNWIIQSELLKYKTFTDILSRFLIKETSGCGIAKYLKDSRISCVAVYGYGILGKCLYDYLLINDIEVKCVIDEIAVDNNINIIRSNEGLPAVDAVIVTAIFTYDDIKEKIMKNKGYRENIPVLNLQELSLDIK